MIGREYSDVYVAACGAPLATRVEGLRHEQECPACRAEMGQENAAETSNGEDEPCNDMK